MKLKEIKENKPIEVVLEKKDGLIWGIVENKGNFVPTPYGETKEAVINSLKKLIKNYVNNEGKKDTFWSKINLDKINFEFRFDLQAFFQEHGYLNISSIAKRAGINPGLLRQYASGVKYPSADQAKKIEDAIHILADELKEISIYA